MDGGGPETTAAPGTPPSGRAPWPPIDLLARIRRDPRHMPERAALFAVDRIGAESSERLARLRRSGSPRREVLETVVAHGVRTAVVDGAFVGGPFIALVPTAFCAALLAQGRMVMEIGELSGRPATDPARAADLLFLQGVYPTVEEARRALDALPPDDGPAGPPGPPGPPRAAEPPGPPEEPPRLSLREWGRVVVRMAYVLGVVTPSAPGPAPGPRPGRYLRWVAVALLVAVGVLLPFVWVPVLGFAYRSATLRLAERAITHFGASPGDEDEDAADAAEGGRPRRGRVRPLALLVALRTLAALLLPFAAAVLLVVSGGRVAGHRWLAVGAGLVAVSLISCVVWRFRQWRRTSGRGRPAAGLTPGAGPPPR
ncbi:hypothetical protein [Kitasatospora sp. NBC_01539]|uniref:hypothetical protein n=1 Tax=Kitasatospora sp. NBC_01539 TaxID=2903577 RepID=UPI00386024E0